MIHRLFRFIAQLFSAEDPVPPTPVEKEEVVEVVEPQLVRTNRRRVSDRTIRARSNRRKMAKMSRRINRRAA